MPGTAHAAQRRHQPVDVPVSMLEHDVLDWEQIHRVDGAYVHAPDPDAVSLSTVDGASTLQSHQSAHQSAHCNHINHHINQHIAITSIITSISTSISASIIMSTL
jgi:hypothetical protein